MRQLQLRAPRHVQPLRRRPCRPPSVRWCVARRDLATSPTTPFRAHMLWQQQRFDSVAAPLSPCPRALPNPAAAYGRVDVDPYRGAGGGYGGADPRAAYYGQGGYYAPPPPAQAAYYAQGGYYAPPAPAAPGSPPGYYGQQSVAQPPPAQSGGYPFPSQQQQQMGGGGGGAPAGAYTGYPPVPGANAGGYSASPYGAPPASLPPAATSGGPFSSSGYGSAPQQAQSNAYAPVGTVYGAPPTPYGMPSQQAQQMAAYGQYNPAMSGAAPGRRDRSRSREHAAAAAGMGGMPPQQQQQQQRY